MGRVREERKRREKSKIREERESEKEEDAGARKKGKVAIHCVFPMIVAPEG